MPAHESGGPDDDSAPRQSRHIWAITTQNSRSRHHRLDRMAVRRGARSLRRNAMGLHDHGVGAAGKRQPAQEDSDHRQHRSIVWTCHAEMHPQNRPAGVLGKDRRQDSGAGIDRNASLKFRDDFYTVDLALNAPRLRRRVEII
jgi:hypothetical protein